MAKSGDDTNNSQFFITEGPRRHLDFNHSIFGILVEGEAVRERISNVATGPDDRPITDVVMESVESFTDTQNAVLMLKAPEGATGAVDITVIGSKRIRRRDAADFPCECDAGSRQQCAFSRRR